MKLSVDKATTEVAARLKLKAGAKVIYLHRARAYDDDVVLVEHIWLPYTRFAKLVPYLETESPPLLYPVYDSLCGVVVSRAIDELEVDQLSPTDAAVFHMPANSSCMRIQRSMHAHSGELIEWRVSYVPADRFHYTVEIR